MLDEEAGFKNPTLTGIEFEFGNQTLTGMGAELLTSRNIKGAIC